MNSERIEYLTSLLSSQQDDPFIRYALALEQINDNPSISLDHFVVLLKKFPDYLPTYYHAANLLMEMEQMEKAKEIIIKGISLAEKLGESKTRDELKTLYSHLMEDS